MALDELFSILTLLVLAEPVFDCLIIKVLQLLALCPGWIADALGSWKGAGKLFCFIVFYCTVDQTASDTGGRE